MKSDDINALLREIFFPPIDFIEHLKTDDNFDMRTVNEVKVI